jgi:endonuclease/exonuclease/phosphatase family metal-dependent hydrolase
MHEMPEQYHASVCPVCQKKFASITAVAQHYSCKTDESHQTHRQENVVLKERDMKIKAVAAKERKEQEEALKKRRDAQAAAEVNKREEVAQAKPMHQILTSLFRFPGRQHVQLTVGTYNILHPEYAEKYRDPEGVGRDRKSNWNVRAPAIGRILEEGGLDVMFLQEVGQEQLADLEPYLAGYDFKSSHMVHPRRSAHDGVVVLTRKGRLKVVSTHPVAFEGKSPEDRGMCYMYATAVVAHDLHTNVRLLLASVHFCKKECIRPQETFLAYLDTAQVQQSCDYVVWGGDCNKVYPEQVVKYSGESFGGQGLSKGDEFKTAEGGSGPTRPRSGKRIDWIFASSSLTVERCAATEAFKRSTMHKIKGTGWPPSDHYGEAVVVKYPHSDEERSGGEKLSSAFSSTGACPNTSQAVEEEEELIKCGGMLHFLNTGVCVCVCVVLTREQHTHTHTHSHTHTAYVLLTQRHKCSKGVQVSHKGQRGRLCGKRNRL